MNIVTDGHATETVSVNDPVMTVLMETGMALKDQHDNLWLKDN